MLTTYEQIDALKPSPRWSREQAIKLRLALRTAVDGYKSLHTRVVQDVQEKSLDEVWRWEFLPALAAEYEIQLVEELYTEGPTRQFGLRLGRMLGNDLQMGLVDTIKAMVESFTARHFMQMYREFLAVGELRLTDVI
jgi:hypothetical protein